MNDELRTASSHLLVQELEQRCAELQRQGPAKSNQQPEPAQEEMPDAPQAAAAEPQPAQEPAQSALDQPKPPAEAAMSQQEAVPAAEPEAAELTDAACSRATPFREEKPADEGTEAAKEDTEAPSAAIQPASVEVVPTTSSDMCLRVWCRTLCYTLSYTTSLGSYSVHVCGRPKTRQPRKRLKTLARTPLPARRRLLQKRRRLRQKSVLCLMMSDQTLSRYPTLAVCCSQCCP